MDRTRNYAKARFYALLGIPDPTGIEWFNGVHEIHAVETFRFLHQHLKWLEPRKRTELREHR